MASFSLVHGAWHGGWAWDRVRGELETRGHDVAAPDLPCDDVSSGIADYARCVAPADVAVGHSLGGLTIAGVAARVDARDRQPAERVPDGDVGRRNAPRVVG